MEIQSFNHSDFIDLVTKIINSDHYFSLRLVCDRTLSVKLIDIREQLYNGKGPVEYTFSLNHGNFGIGEICNILLFIECPSQHLLNIYIDWL